MKEKKLKGNKLVAEVLGAALPWAMLLSIFGFLQKKNWKWENTKNRLKKK